jgi:hypothetical protein
VLLQQIGKRCARQPLKVFTRLPGNGLYGLPGFVTLSPKDPRLDGLAAIACSQISEQKFR